MCVRTYEKHIYTDVEVDQPCLETCEYSDGKRACANVRTVETGIVRQLNYPKYASATSQQTLNPPPKRSSGGHWEPVRRQSIHRRLGSSSMNQQLFAPPSPTRTRTGPPERGYGYAESGTRTRPPSQGSMPGYGFERASTMPYSPGQYQQSGPFTPPSTEGAGCNPRPTVVRNPPPGPSMQSPPESPRVSPRPPPPMRSDPEAGRADARAQLREDQRRRQQMQERRDSMSQASESQMSELLGELKHLRGEISDMKQSHSKELARLNEKMVRLSTLEKTEQKYKNAKDYIADVRSPRVEKYREGNRVDTFERTPERRSTDSQRTKPSSKLSGERSRPPSTSDLDTDIDDESQVDDYSDDEKREKEKRPRLKEGKRKAVVKDEPQQEDKPRRRKEEKRRSDEKKRDSRDDRKRDSQYDDRRKERRDDGRRKEKAYNR